MVLAALCMGNCWAQEDSVVVYNKMLSKSVKVENGITSHKWNLNFLSLNTVSKPSAEPRGGWVTEWNVGPDLIYIGTTQLAGNDVKLNPASSWEWGFDLMKFESWNRRRTFGHKFGILLTRSSYRLDGDNAFHVDDAGNTVLDNALQGHVGKGMDMNYQRQRLIYWSWRMPFVFNFQPSHTWGFSLGAEGELRHHVRSRAKVGSEKKYYIERHNVDVSPWSVNALAALNIGKDFSIVARYNISDFFGDKANFDVQPFMVGLSFDL